MKEKMTSKQRLLCVLNGEEADRIPWSPLIEGFFMSGLKSQANLIEILNKTGADYMLRKVPVYMSSIFSSYEVSENTRSKVPLSNENKDINITEKINKNRIYKKYETPVGTLTEKWETTPSSPSIPFPTEYLIKDLEDLKIYKYLLENEVIRPYFEIFNKKVKRVGDNGLVTTVVPHTPIQHLLIIHMGIENFYYKLFENTEPMEEVMDLMHERNKKICQLIVESPAEVAIEYENTGITYISPEIYSKYEKPAIDDYGKILHQGEIIFLVHMCGQIKKLANMIKDGEQDGICDIAPPPTGDWDLLEAYNTLYPEQIVMGGLDSIRLYNNKQDELEEYVKEILEKVKYKKGLILGNGDSILKGTPLENLQAVTEMVQKFG